MTQGDVLRTRGHGPTGLVVELGFVVVALVANLVVRWSTVDETDAAVAHARDVLDVQQTLGLDWERSVQDFALGAGGLGDLASGFYLWGYLPVVASALVGLYVARPAAYAYLRNALLAAGAVGLLCYAFYPTAPPRLAGLGYVDTVAASDDLDAAARPVGLANELAAMPSFHIAWLVVVAVVVYRSTRSRLLRVACVVEPVLMSYAVVATGNHWVLDVPAGVALAVVGLWVADRLARERRWVAVSSSAAPPDYRVHRASSSLDPRWVSQVALDRCLVMEQPSPDERGETDDRRRDRPDRRDPAPR